VTGERIPAHSRAGSGVSHREAPSNACFQIAAPGPTRWPDRHLEYGSAAGPPQALTLPWRAPRPARFPARLSGPRLIVSAGF